MRLQDYKTGYINKRTDGQYEYVDKGEVVGVYATIAELVKGQNKTTAKRSTRRTKAEISTSES